MYEFAHPCKLLGSSFLKFADVAGDIGFSSVSENGWFSLSELESAFEITIIITQVVVLIVTRPQTYLTIGIWSHRVSWVVCDGSRGAPSLEVVD